MEAVHFEAAVKGDVNKSPFCDIQREDVSEIFHKVSPSGNSLLHVASMCGHKDMTQLIAHYFPLLITLRNNEGNTPLHLAARAQKLQTVEVLVNLSRLIPNTTSTDDTLLTMKNEEGNTALHEALFASKKRSDISVLVASVLISNDPDVACHRNNAGMSPLCVAIESGNKEIVGNILNALPEGNGWLQRLEGKSPVHVAIEHTKLDMLRIIKERKEELLLLRDEEENTPLHIAAYMGYSEGVDYLLEIKSNWALERNNKGLYPLHLACENGHIKVSKQLSRKCWPNPAELVCSNGQSILHAAVKSGKDNAVRCILKEKGVDNLVNKKDKNGNTPFHLAALHGHSMVVLTLLSVKPCKADLVNSQGLTAYDIFKSHVLTKVLGHQIEVNSSGNVEAQVDSKSFGKLKLFQMMMVYSKLYMYFEFFRHSSTKTSRIKIKPPVPDQNLNNTINYLFVVAALIIGAAFAGALQIPFQGGNSTDHGSAPALAPASSQDHSEDELLQYLSYNMITMNLSVTAAFTLFLALLVDTNLATILVSVSFLLLELALTCMGLAFFAAIWLWTQPLIIDIDVKLLPILAIDDVFQRFQIVVVLVSIVTFALGRDALAVFIYWIFSWFYFPLYRIWIMIPRNLLKNFIKLVLCVSFFHLGMSLVFFGKYLPV